MKSTLEKECFVENVKSYIEKICNKATKQQGDIFQTKLVEIKEQDKKLWITLASGIIEQSISIPIPIVDEKGLCFIEDGHVRRAVGSWYIDGTEIDYWKLMYSLLTDSPQKFSKTSSKRNHLERLVKSFLYGAAPIVFKNFQKIINSHTEALPIVGTDMQNWAMCNRMQLVDISYEDLPPERALEHHKIMNELLFPYTSLGLSDSGMCNNNILSVDVRRTIPFGLGYHNPRRNLYQTLGMHGDETPKIMSEYEKGLSNKGIVRTGWSLMTAFVDMPLNFEDQIIVSERLAGLFITESRSYTCFGTTLVHEGDQVDFLYPLSIEPDGTFIRFDTRAETAQVSKIEKETINFNNTPTEVTAITITYKRTFKDGFKLTNRHGNKGIVVLKDTGVAHDPVRGDIPIDIIVSAKSVGKRKNFGQILEALCSLLNGKDKELVIEDNYSIDLKDIKKRLVEKGYEDTGCLHLDTQWGHFTGVAGWVFWGCSKTPEDQIWTKHDTTITDSRGVRQAGNKLSHIEFRALLTMFGKDNPIVKEVLKYSQGEEQVFEYIRILESLVTEEKDTAVIAWDEIKPVDQSSGFFHHLVEFNKTISDETIHPAGFYIQLPDNYKYVIKKGAFSDFSEDFTKDPIEPDANTYILDKILMPAAFLRKPWKHSSGLFGLSDVAAIANAVINSIHKYKNEETDITQVGRSIFLYFHTIASTLSSKNGKISNYCLSVRYPYTVKATASVSDNLEENHIEIHRDMAKDLKVLNGDLVLVERFPCLGFMSVRAQRVCITDDPNAKYVVRVSGSSLASLTLDFDGDVVYLMSFQNKQAREALEKEFNQPHPARLAAYKEASAKNIPIFKEMALEDYNIQHFGRITAEDNAEIVGGLVGIKMGTGTIIALCYNIMRILENSIGYSDTDTAIAMEVLLDKVANSVFSRKHAGKSLEKECREAICTADVNKMVKLGFDKEASQKLAGIVQERAAMCGFHANSLAEYYERAEKEGRSSIINIIVRRFHKLWFTTRSSLHPILMVKNLHTEPKDLTGWMFQHSKDKLASNKI